MVGSGGGEGGGSPLWQDGFYKTLLHIYVTGNLLLSI